MGKNGGSLSQLAESLKRISIEKRRTLRGTLCECFSHLILIFILVGGYRLSILVKEDDRIYSEITVTIPPSALTATDSAQSEQAFELYNQLLSGPLIVPSLDQYVGISRILNSAFGRNSQFLTVASLTGVSFANLVNLGDIHFSPNDQATQSLIDYMNTTYLTFRQFNVYKHDSEIDALDYILNNLESSAFGLISLRQVSDEKVNYVIRQNYTVLANTNEVIVSPAIGLNQRYQSYFFSGFLTLQRAVDEWVFEYTNASSSVTSPDCANGPPVPFFIPYPTYAYNQNPFYAQVGFLLGIVLVMSTLYPMSKLTKSIVEEKESKMRELMMIMGLREWVHRASWFLSAFVLFFWIAISTLFISSISFFPNSDPTLLFLFFFLFAMSEINFAFLVSVFFSNAKLAAIAGPIILFGSILPRYIFYSTNNYEQATNKILACVLSPTAFAFGADLIAQFENGNVGIQYSNMFIGDLNFAIVLVMLWVDFYIYGFLAWYLDQVLPHENGTAKHPLFLFSFKYWFNVSVKSGSNEVDFDSMPEFHDGLSHSTIEPIVGDEMIARAKIRIKGLGKMYPDGKIAVRNLSLSMIEGQITCLLGHNGAGKTTTMSALTGLIEATTGDVSIYGHSLKRELYNIRRMTGLCPQLNVFFPFLTVEEHLRFFGVIKGLTGRDLMDAVDIVISDVGLTEKRHIRSHALSGGQKRKLCLSMALIGDPKFVLLDEPTSGMDPFSRRSTWSLLQKSKIGRVLLLSTHFLDEADTLADRIAIMSEGRLLCSGSSLFLKNKFGVGYLLSLSKSAMEASVTLIQQAIQQIVCDAKLHSQVAGEVIFSLPFGTSSQFGELFRMLQESAKDLQIGSYGISITSLEQVFIRLAHARPEELATIEDDMDLAAFEDDRFHTDLISRIVLWLKRLLLTANSASSNSGSNSPASASAGMIGYAGVPITDTSIANTGRMKSQPQTTVDDDNLMVPVIKGEEEEKSVEMKLSSIVVSSIQDEETKKGDRDIPPPVTTNNAQEEEEEIDHKLLDSGTDGISQHSIFIQLHELYMKRIIILRRDIKGFVFQILLPGLLIVLILLILTVSLNVAGRLLKLDGDFIHRYTRTIKSPNYLTAGTSVQSNTVSKTMLSYPSSRWTIDTEQVGISPNSTQLSYFLLNREEYVQDRFAAFVYGDNIPVTTTVDWDWVRLVYQENAGTDDQVQAIVTSIFPVNSSFTSQQVQSALDLFGFNVTSLIGNNNNDDIGGQVITIKSGETFTLFNITFVIPNTPSFDFNITIPSNINNIVDLNTLVLDQNVTFIVTPRGIEADFVILDTTVPVLFPWSLFTYSSVQSSLPTGVQTTITSIASQYTIMHNASSPHGVVALQGQLLEWAFQTCTNKSSAASSAASSLALAGSAMPFFAKGATSTSIRPATDTDGLPQYVVKNHPLPLTAQESLTIQIILSILASIFILVPLCYIPASFVAFIVKERVCKAKHLQIVSGVSPYLYWVATWLWDMTLFTFLSLFIVAVLFAFGENVAKVFIGTTDQTLAVLCLLLLYGMSCLPLAYLYSFAFVNFSTAQIAIMVINFMTGFVLVLAQFTMEQVPLTQKTAAITVHFFRIFPAFCVGEGFLNLSTNYFYQTILGAGTSVWAWECTGRDLTFMLVESIGYFSIVLLSETQFAQDIGGVWLRLRGIDSLAPPPRKTPADEDVINEEELVRRIIESYNSSHTLLSTNKEQGEGLEEGNVNSKMALVIDQLIKTYPSLDAAAKPKFAVRGMSLACSESERFGLLGINGAGKTTTLGVLTCEIKATSGEVYVAGHPLSDPKTRKLFGYCPQVDPLLDLMNSYETLHFFGAIRGIEKTILKQRVESLIKQTGLTPHAHRPCGTYSGGNKRKLSLAVALIGDPKVLLLDEPSTGLDPEARRSMWTVIQQVSASRTVILVSHSMEEIEALCSRVGVMVSGRMQCLGSVQHLKGKFGTGYQVEVRCGVHKVDECLALCNAILKNGGYEIEEQHGGYFRLQVAGMLDLGTAFSTLEANKEVLEIYDYSISQCSFEQVFIKFAKEQEEEPASGSSQRLGGSDQQHQSQQEQEAAAAVMLL